MSLNDLVFTYSGDVIQDPISIPGGTSITVTVLNNGVDDLTNLGIYLTASSSLGDVDNLAEYPPDTDYVDALTWGTQSVATSGTGGITVTRDVGGVSTTDYFTFTNGSTAANKLTMDDLAAGSSTTLTIEAQDPGSATPRITYVNIMAE